MTFTHPSGAYAVLFCVWSADPDMGMPDAGYLVLEYADQATYRTSGWKERHEFKGTPNAAAILAVLGAGWSEED